MPGLLVAAPIRHLSRRVRLAGGGQRVRMAAWGVLTYTFHPHIIGRGHRMLLLERLIRGLREQGATFVTMEGALAAYRREFPNGHSLRGN